MNGGANCEFLHNLQDIIFVPTKDLNDSVNKEVNNPENNKMEVSSPIEDGEIEDTTRLIDGELW
jgi:hypothetical protein